MPAQSRLNDITIGVGSHGLPCCPHTIVSIRIMGSNLDMVNGVPSSRITDISCHMSCPHCGISICITGSNLKIIEGLESNIIGDVVTEICGFGTTVT